jgi:hypothetical protein
MASGYIVLPARFELVSTPDSCGRGGYYGVVLVLGLLNTEDPLRKSQTRATCGEGDIHCFATPRVTTDGPLSRELSERVLKDVHARILTGNTSDQHKMGTDVWPT